MIIVAGTFLRVRVISGRKIEAEESEAGIALYILAKKSMILIVIARPFSRERKRERESESVCVLEGKNRYGLSRSCRINRERKMNFRLSPRHQMRK